MEHNERYLEMFWYWIREREAIRIRKESGEDHPWSLDHVLNTYHFCNVRREDDRGTKELRAVVLHKVDNVEALPWAYTLARMFNYAPPLSLALDNIDVDWVEMLKEAKDCGAKIFHPAYVVSTCGMSMDKIDYVASTVRAVRKLVVPHIGLKNAHDKLMTVNGLGSFLAGQVVADLRNDRYLAPLDASEAKIWSAWGPGSKKGLNLIFGPGTQPGTYQKRMIDLFWKMPDDIQAMNIHAQDLQNCLCEFSKYVRHLDTLGGRIRYYTGK